MLGRDRCSWDQRGQLGLRTRGKKEEGGLSLLYYCAFGHAQEEVPGGLDLPDHGTWAR